MSQIHPITGAVIGATPAAQRMQSADKAAQLRRAAAKKAGRTASNSDTFEPQIESAHELEPIGDEHHQNRRQNQNQDPKKPIKPPANAAGEGESNLDVKA